MKHTAKILLFGICGLVLALANGEVAAQAIAVTPADPTISVGQTQQFTATGITNVTAIDAGAYHTCALLQDGSIQCWGLNDYRQLSDPAQFSSSTPLAVAGIMGAAAVAGGGFHTCARFPDGTLECWGRNSEGQLGDPATTAFVSAAPVPVSGITTAIAVTAGGFHTCALLQNGTVRCWGLNDFGQLGNGTMTPAPPSTPIPNRTSTEVLGITDAVAVSAGGWHTCALLANGTVRCWGQNSRGQVGDGSLLTRPETDRPTPTPVTVVGLTTAVALNSGIFHTCAILQDGTMQCWGWNDFWQLGNTGAANNSSTPVTVNGVTPAAIAAGAEHTCVRLPNGRVNCWGDNGFAQLGNGSPRGVFAPPTADVTAITTATVATSGAEHSCALLSSGRVQCWGRGLFGRIGDGTANEEDRFTPVTVVGLGITWTSSDTTVATINATGLATGRSPGSNAITATSGNRAGSTTLTVGAPPSLSVIREGTGSGIVTSSPAGIDCGATCSASYDQNSVVTLTATRTGGSTFEGWNGGGCSGTGLCTLTLTANTTVTARFALPRFTLSVTRDGTGSGTVTSNPAGIDCGATCSASYDQNTAVTLTATPATGFTFEGWSGGSCSGTGTCTVTLTANTTVTARFGIPRFTLSVTREGNGTVTSSPAGINCGATCSASYDQNTVVTLTATAASGSTFQGWNGGGCSGTGLCTVTLTANTTVVARFIPRFTLSVTREGNGTGTATSSPTGINCGAACSASYDQGTMVTLTAAPATGSTSNGWTGCDTVSGTTCTVTMSVARSATATFNLQPPDSSLVAAYGFDEGTGTTTADASGNNRTAAISGATWTTQGRFGNGLSFDGVNDRVTYGAVTLGPAFTLMAWVFNPTNAAYETIVTVGSTRDLYLRSGVITLYTGGTDRTFGGAISTNTWHYVAVVYDGATLRAYLNGAPQGTAQAVSLPAVTGTVQIGAWITGSSNVDFFGGRIDEVRVYNRALAQAEVQQAMSTPIGTPPADTTPPVRSGGQPTGTLPAGTTQATLSLVTSEAATCRYATTPGAAYSAMTGTFTATEGTAHATTVGGFADGGSYTFHVRCQDQTGNVNPDDFGIIFSVASPPPPQTFALSVTRAGTGSGTVTSSPPGIDCGGTCTASYNGGTTVTLTAAPAHASTLVGWSGCDAASGATCTVTTNAPRSVTATFGVAVVSAPVLKWQYGGCTAGPRCLIGWYSSPAVADLDVDGQPDVIWGSSGDVVALRGDNGSLKWRAPGVDRVWPDIAVADLTGDGTLEVIVGRGAGADQLTVYDRFGNIVWARTPFAGAAIRTLAVADLENDGRLEIVVGRALGSEPWPATRQLTVFSSDGTVRPGWPARRDGEPGYGGGMYNQNVAVADMNGDGLQEVFGPSGGHYVTALDRDGNQLLVNGIYTPRQYWSQVGVHVDHAADLRGYANCGVEHRPNFGISAPVIADLNGDGVPELIVVGNAYNCGTGGSLYHVPFVFNRDRTRWSGSGFDWTVLPTPAPGSAPRSEDYAVIEAAVPNPVVADLDGDGFMEILYPSYDGRVHAYWLDRTQRGNWPYTVPTTGAAGDDFRFASEPVVADLNNDGCAEVIFTSWPQKTVGGVGQLHVLNCRGEELHRIDLPAPALGRTWNGGLAAPTIANIDDDADLELVIGTVTSGVVAYDLPNTAGARILWGTGRGNYRRAGTRSLP